jgi:preprotein translocase subunit SecA
VAIFEKLLRAGEGRMLRKLQAIADAVNSIEDHYVDMSDEELREQTEVFKQRYADGESLDDLMPEAFATVREAAKRVLNKRHYDVQIMGGAALHYGNIAEMKTGEGKTLVSTLPAYLNALTGKGVHVITTNDYLAQRDAEWMGQVHRFLGLTVGVVLPNQVGNGHREAYECDITYGTNNEFGFDYLRDNMAMAADELVQRGHHFAIVDEVDSILIDEARTPLIISGPAEQSARWYQEFAKIVARLEPGKDGENDYEVDESKRTVAITERGVSRVEDRLGVDNLYESANTPLVGYLNNALKAKELYKRDRDYIVSDEDEVLIVDEFTGRILHGRRYNEGMHQAIEAKEGVEIKQENQTLATITLQNYFRLYDKLSGMTGTAMTEAGEFQKVYKVGVVPIPTHRPMIRADKADVVYKSEKAKFNAVIEDIVERHQKGQPVLVGTVSVENSEILSQMLRRKGIPHSVLNAKYHAKEAEIIAQAGRRGAVTVATNMAGRGTDILLGGNPEFLATAELRNRGLDPVEGPEEYETALIDAIPRWKKQCDEEADEVVDAGGLYVLGTERHDARRIDNQLRGRSGRQGDPGHSKFFLSLEDDLMRIFGSDKLDGMLQKLGLKENEAIVHPWINKALEKAQQKVEARNFDIRKNLLKFDNVMNDQRKVIFEQRLELMRDETVDETITDMRHAMIEDTVAKYVPENAYPEQWNVAGLDHDLREIITLALPVQDWAKEEGITGDDVRERITRRADEWMAGKVAKWGPDVMRYVEKSVLLQTLDHLWREHLVMLEHLRQVIGLRGYGQRDPLNEYKAEAFALFETMVAHLREAVTAQLMRVEVVQSPPAEEAAQLPYMEAHKVDPTTGEDEMAPALAPALVGNGNGAQAERKANDPSTWGKVGRNELCPCGSGKKFKHCHGKFA